MFGSKRRNEKLDTILAAALTDPGAPFEKENLEFLAELKQKKPEEWQRARPFLKDSGILVSALEAEIERVIRNRIHVVQKEEPVVDNDRERHGMHAEAIIESGDVLKLFAEDFAHLIAGETRIGKLLYLVGTSRLFRKPMSAVVKGVSSAGKSEVREGVLSFFPATEVISFTAFSARALVFDKRPFDHRIISMGEAAGVEDESLQDYFIRELISAGKLRYSLPQKGGDGKLEGGEIVKDGPVSFMITTTRTSLHKENETRLLSLEIDDSQEQTARVINRVARYEGLGKVGQEIDFGRWHAFQYWLRFGPREVIVPWAEQLGWMIPPKAVRLRRDTGQLLRAIKAHALLNQHHREVIDGKIVASIEKDYAPVRELMADMLAEGVDAKVKESIIETVLAVGFLTDGEDKTKGCTAAEVGRKLNMSKDVKMTVRRRLHAAREAGFIVNLETKRGHPGRWTVTDLEIENEDIIPPWDDLDERWNSRE